MAWVRLDDDFRHHPKVVSAGPLAGWLYVCGLTYCNHYLTDGFIAHRQVPLLSTVDNPYELAAALVNVNLWEEAEGGYRVHDYFDHNPTAKEVRAKREEARERMARGRDAQARSRELRTKFSGPTPTPTPTPMPGEKAAAAAARALVMLSEQNAGPKCGTAGEPASSDTVTFADDPDGMTLDAAEHASTFADDPAGMTFDGAESAKGEPDMADLWQFHTGRGASGSEIQRLKQLYEQYGPQMFAAALAETAECAGRSVRYTAAVLKRMAGEIPPEVNGGNNHRPSVGRNGTQAAPAGRGGVLAGVRATDPDAGLPEL